MIDDVVRTAFFEATGLHAPLPEGWYYHDEEALVGVRKRPFSLPKEVRIPEVKLLEIVTQHESRYLTEVCGMKPEDALGKARNIAVEKYGLEVATWLLSDYFSLGMYFVYAKDFGKGKETHVHIFYIDDGIPEVTFQTRAHEEFHAIKSIPGALDRLEQHILQTQGLTVNFKDIKNEELAAYLNAVITLVARGMSPQPVLRYFEELGAENAIRDFKRALKTYEAIKDGRNPNPLANFYSRVMRVFA